MPGAPLVEQDTAATDVFLLPQERTRRARWCHGRLQSAPRLLSTSPAALPGAHLPAHGTWQLTVLLGVLRYNIQQAVRMKQSGVLTLCAAVGKASSCADGDQHHNTAVWVHARQHHPLRSEPDVCRDRVGPGGELSGPGQHPVPERLGCPHHCAPLHRHHPGQQRCELPAYCPSTAYARRSHVWSAQICACLTGLLCADSRGALPGDCAASSQHDSCSAMHR